MQQPHSVRWLETDKIIRSTALEMLKNTPLERLSVRALCEAAGINRSTFYLHYQDVFALFAAIEIEMYEQLIALYPPDTRVLSPETLRPFFTYAREHRDFYEIALRTRSYTPRMPGLHLQDFHLLLEYYTRPLFETAGIREQKTIDYLLWHFQGGFLLCLQQWLEGGCKESDEEMAEMITRCFPELFWHPEP